MGCPLPNSKDPSHIIIIKNNNITIKRIANFIRWMECVLWWARIEHQQQSTLTIKRMENVIVVSHNCAPLQSGWQMLTNLYCYQLLLFDCFLLFSLWTGGGKTTFFSLPTLHVPGSNCIKPFHCYTIRSHCFQNIFINGQPTAKASPTHGIKSWCLSNDVI